MNPTLILAIAQGVSALIEIWRQHAGKPVGWTPTQADWDELLLVNDKTAEDYKREAREALNPMPPIDLPPMPIEM